MAKKLTYSLTYPKPIEAAFADLQNPAFQEGKLLNVGAKDPKVTISSNEDGSVTIVLERHNPVTGVPSAVKKLTGDWQHVIEKMTWGAAQADGSRVAPHVTEFVGLPLAMQGTLTLTPNGDVTLLTLDAEFKSGVPLVGGKLESTAIDETKTSMDAEGEFSGRFTG
jgi:hypothetical protein